MSKTRGDIYASIIHDLNGPLTVISGFVQLMNQRIENTTRLEVEDLEFVRERMKTITRQVANCIQLSRRYLGFLRRQSEEMPQAGVNDLLNDLSHLIRVHPSLRQNRFSIQPLVPDIMVRMNGTDLIQTVLNLAVNAFQCTAEPHSVAVDGGVLNDPLDLTRFKDGPGERMLNMEGFANTAPLLALCVRDTGPGIPTEILPKIFQPYFTTKSNGHGTGLGLNIVHRLIKEANGALHVHTEQGKGTVFTIYLPASPPSAPSAA